MTTRKACLVVAALSLITVGAASSATAGSSVFGGANFPTGDFNNGSDVGWVLGGYHTAPVIPMLVDVGGTLAYNKFSLSSDDSFNAWELQALGQVNILFLKGFLGLGLANFSGFDDDGNSDRRTKWAWQLGAAAQFLMLEGRLAYHKIDVGEGSVNWVSLTVGLNF